MGRRGARLADILSAHICHCGHERGWHAKKYGYGVCRFPDCVCEQYSEDFKASIAETRRGKQSEAR